MVDMSATAALFPSSSGTFRYVKRWVALPVWLRGKSMQGSASPLFPPYDHSYSVTLLSPASFLFSCILVKLRNVERQRSPTGVCVCVCVTSGRGTTCCTSGRPSDGRKCVMLLFPT